MTFTPRAHQSDAVDAVFSHWQNNGGNALVSIAVGGGKSHTQGLLASKIMGVNPNVRVLGLTLTKELIGQNAKAAREVWSGVPVGINCAGLKRRDTKAPLLFAQPASIINNIRALGPRHIVMVDECHAISHEQEKTLYGRIFAELRKLVPDMRIVGLTGTPYRLSTGRLDEPWKDQKPIFDKLVYEYSILDGIRDGFLVPPITKDPGLVYDTSKIGTRGGEFVASQAQKAVDTDELNRKIVGNILEWTRDRNSVVVFAAGVEHAKHIKAEFERANASAVLVEGNMPDKVRDEALDFFKRGAAKYLINVNVAGTGFDHRPIDGIALARPTKSMGLLTQFIGRGLRASPGKENCLVLDYAGAVRDLGPVDTFNGRKIASAPGKAPTKKCPDCSTLHPTSVRKCPCGHEFPEGELKLNTMAGAGAVLSTQQDSKWYDVQQVHYSLFWRKGADGKPDPKIPASLRITYNCGPTINPSEFLAFKSEKAGARHFAKQKWANRTTTGVVPDTAEQALGIVKDLRKPARVQLRKNGKYFDVLTVDFSVAAAPPPPSKHMMTQAEIDAALAASP